MSKPSDLNHEPFPSCGTCSVGTTSICCDEIKKLIWTQSVMGNKGHASAALLPVHYSATLHCV